MSKKESVQNRQYMEEFRVEAIRLAESVGGNAHLAANEVAQPRALARNDFGEARGVGWHVQAGWRQRAG